MFYITNFTKRLSPVLKTGSSRKACASFSTLREKITNEHEKKIKPEIDSIPKEEFHMQNDDIILDEYEEFSSETTIEEVISHTLGQDSRGNQNFRHLVEYTSIENIETYNERRFAQTYGTDPADRDISLDFSSGIPASFEDHSWSIPPYEILSGLDLRSEELFISESETSISHISEEKFYEETNPDILTEKDYNGHNLSSETGQDLNVDNIIRECSPSSADLGHQRFRRIRNSIGDLFIPEENYSSECLQSIYGSDDIVTPIMNKSKIDLFEDYISTEKVSLDIDEERLNLKMQEDSSNQTISSNRNGIHQSKQPEFMEHLKQAINNSKKLCEEMIRRDHLIITNFTNNPIIAWNLRPYGLTALKFEAICDQANIILKTNLSAIDRSAQDPYCVRLGNPACTTRGYKEEHMEDVASFLDRILQEALKIQNERGKKLSAFKRGLTESDEVKKISQEVRDFARQFELPGLQI
ncbi:unnamed protein product [Moneuplotes crassus]|uniref:Serine hydroxymethyltransferase-like domain-containing protein n=1 Tax=Euplotes crassus TaxID=5936 RepID=A0AAD1X9V7_EUPCR|nr:unnamed protein product [Moneuplotes crassus]